MPSVDNSWSSTSLVPTQQQRYLWKFEYIYYSDGSVEVTDPVNLSIAGVDADTSGVTDAINKNNQAIEEAKQQLETVRNDSLASAEEAKQQLATVADDLSKAKTDFQNAVSAVDTKATNLQSDLTQAKQDLASQAQQLQAQAIAQSELTKRVSSVEKTANGTKTTVGELSKTVAQNGKDITSVTARTKVVEDDLSGTKTTLSQVKTTADSASQKTATLETGLNGLTAKFDSLSVGGANLFKGSRDFSGSWLHGGAGVYAEDYQGVKIFKRQDLWVGLSQYFEVKTGEEYVFSAYVKSSAKTDRVTFFLYHDNKQPAASGVVSYGSFSSSNSLDIDLTDEYQRIAIKIKITSSGWIAPRLERSNTNAYLFFGGYKLERGNVATDYSPNEADLEQKVAEYKQTADQNYASLQSTVQNLDGTVQANKTTAEQTAAGFKTRIESLETYKDGETTRANQYFESAKTETARQLSVERTAIAKDYVAKSTYTSDVTGIRNELSATTATANTTKTNLANYQATNDRAVANLQSNIQTANGDISSLKTKVEAVPGQITSAVSAVDSKIPTSIGGRNLWIQSKATGGFVEETLPDNHVTGQKKCYRIPNNQKLYFNIEPDFSSRLYQKVTFSAWVKYENVVQGDKSWNKFNCFKHGLVRKNSSTGATTDTDNLTIVSFTGTSDWKYITYTYDYAANKSYDQLKTSIRFHLESARSGTAWVTGVKIELGSIPSDYTPAPEDTAEQISSLSSEFKQTTDAIKASVSSLDSSTVKSSSLTINTDGIVMKAGKSTTDVANAIGSYFAVNQNAINLFSDKINVKGSMIVDGAITGDKIKANSVDVSKIVGIDADYIKAKIEYAMIDWLKGKTITAYNDNMTIDLQDGRISFKDGSNAVYRQTPDGIHTGFLHFEAGSQGGIYAAFGATSTRQGINSKSSEFAGIRCYRVSANGDSHEAKIDKIEVIGDTVQFGHGYRSDGSIGGGFIMDTAAYANETPYSFNRVIKSIESLWRILHDHAKNTGYRFDDSAFINALNNEYNAWHDMHND